MAGLESNDRPGDHTRGSSEECLSGAASVVLENDRALAESDLTPADVAIIALRRRAE